MLLQKVKNIGIFDYSKGELILLTVVQPLESDLTEVFERYCEEYGISESDCYWMELNSITHDFMSHG
jgi:thiaminase